MGTTSHTSKFFVSTTSWQGPSFTSTGGRGSRSASTDLVLERSRIVDVEEPGDALGAREDVVADARVRVALHLVEEQGGAAIEVLLDGRDLEMRDRPPRRW